MKPTSQISRSKNSEIRVQAILPLEVYKKAALKLVERNDTWQKFISDQIKKLAESK